MTLAICEKISIVSENKKDEVWFTHFPVENIELFPKILKIITKV